MGRLLRGFWLSGGLRYFSAVVEDSNPDGKTAVFRRVLLKLSGEALMGPRAFGIDSDRLHSIARTVRRVSRRGVEVAIVVGGRIKYVDRPGYVAPPVVERTGAPAVSNSAPAVSNSPVPHSPPKLRKPKAKNDPRLVAAARELRDRWMEKVNSDPSILLSQGKYDVSKESPVVSRPLPVKALPVAA